MRWGMGGCPERFVYLLDEALGLGYIGLFTVNLTGLLVKGATELPYRE